MEILGALRLQTPTAQVIPAAVATAAIPGHVILPTPEDLLVEPCMWTTTMTESITITTQ